MMRSFLPFIILSCMLYKTVVTQVWVSDNGYPANGATITLTCNITSFTLPSSWINDSSSGSLSICLPAGTCSPSASGRYSYSATSSTIVAQISAFDATIDNFGWKCRHNTDTYVYTFTFTTVTPTTISSSTTGTPETTEKPKCELELGLGLGLGLGIPCVITAIDIGIFIYIGYEYPYYLGLVIGLGVGFTFEVGWIIIASLLSTGNECKLELGLGLGLGSGIPDVIAYVVSVIFVFFVVTIFINIPNRVELGKGILTGLLIASVLGIILVILLYDKLKRKQTCTTHKDNPQEADVKKTEQVPLEPNVKNSQTNNSGGAKPNE